VWESMRAEPLKHLFYFVVYIVEPCAVKPQEMGAQTMRAALTRREGARGGR